MNTKITRREK